MGEAELLRPPRQLPRIARGGDADAEIHPVSPYGRSGCRA
jgi:hypothetical protein